MANFTILTLLSLLSFPLVSLKIFSLRILALNEEFSCGTEENY